LGKVSITQALPLETGAEIAEFQMDFPNHTKHKPFDRQAITARTHNVRG
jgi:hypothetical protein